MNGARKFPQVAVRMPPDLKEWLQQQAKDEHRSLNGQIVQLLESLYVKRTQPAEGTQ